MFEEPVAMAQGYPDIMRILDSLRTHQLSTLKKIRSESYNAAFVDACRLIFSADKGDINERIAVLRQAAMAEEDGAA